MAPKKVSFLLSKIQEAAILACVAQLVGGHPVDGKVMGSIFSRVM